LFVNRIDKSFKKSFLFYYFLDQVILRINIKFNLVAPDEEIILDNKSLKVSFKNYEINTKDAINLSKQKNVDEFYILSLFKRTDLPIKKNNYFNYLFDKTIYNIEKNTYSKIIDLTKNINQVNKNNFFCDSIHKTIIGNQYVSEAIYKYLINNSKILSE